MSIVQVLVPKDESLLGKVVDVLITSAGKHYMKCSVISNVQPLNIPSPLPKGHISGVQAVPMVGDAHCSLQLMFSCWFLLFCQMYKKYEQLCYDIIMLPLLVYCSK